MNLKRIAVAVIAATTLAAGLNGAAVGDERGRGHERRRAIEHRNVWHGDIHRFREHDFALWRSGRWVRAHHNGRFGWWWIVGGIWYFYPAAVYPYPDPYQPPIVALPPPPVARQYWYSCGNPQGYYPYVAQCLTAWRPVPAEPTVPAYPAPMR